MLQKQHEVIVAYINLLHDHGLDSKEAEDFKNAHREDTRFMSAVRNAEQLFVDLDAPDPVANVLLLIDRRWREDFCRYIHTGEASTQFRGYLDTTPDAQRAVELVFEAQAAAFEELSTSFKT